MTIHILKKQILLKNTTRSRNMDDFYQKQFAKALTTEYDSHFFTIKHLTWLPWVGKDYINCRILIVAESHYTNASDSTRAEQDIKVIMNDLFYTRAVLAEYPMLGYDAGWKNNGGRGNNPTFDNLFRLLISEDLLNDPEPHSRRTKLCSNFAYINMIQRPMWYPPKRPKERPNDNDRTTGWNVVVDVLRILMPDICIFAGAEASSSFGAHMNRLQIPYENWKCVDKKIGNTYPQSTVISLNGKYIPFKFIRHPGSYFSWNRWQAFVFEDCKHIQDKLLSIMNG